METKNVKFEETASEIATLHNWDTKDADFFGFALLNIGGQSNAVCLLKKADSYRYHSMDGSAKEVKGTPQFEPLNAEKHKNRVFREFDIFVVIKIKDNEVYWEVHSCGGVPECFRNRCQTEETKV